jgi:hypothetical protein
LFPALAFTPRMELPTAAGLGFAPDLQVIEDYCVERVVLL